MKTMGPEYVETSIPGALMKRIEAVEDCFIAGREKGLTKRVAAFDLDNTLLEGDVGDALFAQLKRDGYPLSLTWAEYQRMIKEEGKKAAYSKVVTVMAGIPVETVIETTRRVMTSTAPFLELEGAKIPVPRPNPLMQTLVSYLEDLGYTVYIISATNQYSVKTVAGEYFGIPPRRAVGIRPSIVEDETLGPVLGEEILEPVTVTQGKVDAYRECAGTTPPLITGGDSATDIPMLNLTHPRGLVLWVGKDRDGYESVKQELRFPGTAYFLERVPRVF